MRNHKKTIIGFDSWTGGIRHYIRLVDSLNNLGYHLILIHIGSWGHDKNREKEEFIDGLHVRDISFYKGMSFAQILKKEQPDAIIFLSLSAFAHMSFNRIALYLNIPTFNLFHGLVNVQEISSENPNLSKYEFNFLWDKISKTFFKNVFKLIPNYINSLIITKAPLKQWVKIVEHIIDKLSNNLHLNDDCITTKTFVYTESDVNYAYKTLSCPLNTIEVVGNPDLIDFNIDEKHLGISLNSDNRKSKIVYIDTGTIDWGFGHKNFDDYFNHYLQTSEYVKTMGYELSVKLHPSILKNYSLKKFKDSGIEIIDNNSFLEHLISAKAGIVETSSVSIIPAFLGLPIFFAKYGNLKEMNFGALLQSYPRSKSLNNLSDLKELLIDIDNHLDIRSINSWIKNNVGPLPPMEMPNRVATHIDKIIIDKV